MTQYNVVATNKETGKEGLIHVCYSAEQAQKKIDEILKGDKWYNKRTLENNYNFRVEEVVEAEKVWYNQRESF